MRHGFERGDPMTISRFGRLFRIDLLIFSSHDVVSVMLFMEVKRSHDVPFSFHLTWRRKGYMILVSFKPYSRSDKDQNWTCEEVAEAYKICWNRKGDFPENCVQIFSLWGCFRTLGWRQRVMTWQACLIQQVK